MPFKCILEERCKYSNFLNRKNISYVFFEIFFHAVRKGLIGWKNLSPARVCGKLILWMFERKRV